MDNLDKIKYKEAGKDWFIKIFLNDKGNEISRTGSFKDGKGSGTGLCIEMKAWLKIKGNEIEPQFTDEELAEKESSDKQQVLDSQNSDLIRLLNDSEKHVSNDPPYPDGVDQWKTARGKWRTLLKSNKLGEIASKPF